MRRVGWTGGSTNLGDDIVLEPDDQVSNLFGVAGIVMAGEGIEVHTSVTLSRRTSVFIQGTMIRTATSGIIQTE